jgi:hypothetical protein
MNRIDNSFKSENEFSERMKPYAYKVLRTLTVPFPLSNLEEASPEDDMKHGVDLYVRVSSIYIALRIRRYITSSNHRTIDDNDVTIRSQIITNDYKEYDTEIHKLRNGSFLAKYYFYCVMNKEENKVAKWILWDVHKTMSVKIRENGKEYGFWDRERINQRWKNFSPDRNNYFYAVPVSDLKDIGAVIAQYGYYNL